MKRAYCFAALLLAIAMISVTFAGCDSSKSAESYKITISAYDTSMGTVSLSPDKTEFSAGEEITIKAQAKDGYVIQGAYLDTNDISNELRSGKGEYTFKATRDRTLRVDFVSQSEVKYDCALSLTGFKSYQGEVKVEPDRMSFSKGEEISVSISPKENCTLGSVKVNGVDYTDRAKGGSFTTNISSDTEIAVEFIEDWTVIWHATVVDFDDQIDVEGKCLVDFYALWCGPCMNILGPMIDKLVTQGKLKIIKIEVSDINGNPYPEQAIYTKYAKGVNSIPFQLLFEDGALVKTQVGALTTYEQFTSWIGV